MEAFIELKKLQQTAGDDLQKIIANYKKDPADRKTTTYYTERLSRLNDVWTCFEERDKEIRSLSDVVDDDDYFDYFIKIMKLFQQYSVEFETRKKSTTLTNSNIHNDTLGSTESRIMGLIRRQRSIETSIRRIIYGSESDDGENIQQFYEVKYRMLEQLWQQTQTLNQTIWETHENPIEFGYEPDAFEMLEKLVQHELISLSSKAQSATVVKGQNSAAQPHNATFHLPKITVPKFDGDYTKWPEFFDLFSDMVDSQPLSDAQKMWYLKCNVTGEAEGIIRNYTISHGNYASAWLTLQKRYNNKRLLTSTLLDRILQQPNLTQSPPLASDLKRLFDTTTECLEALGNIGIDSKSWDPLLLHLLLQKLDQKTRLSYERSLTDPRSLQSVSDFLEFIEKYFESLQSISQKTKQPRPRICTSVLSNKTTCKCCEGTSHPLYSCPRFLKLNNSDRMDFVKKLQLCFNCLKSGHTAANCLSRHCNNCDKKHNTLLHADYYQRKVDSNNSAGVDLAQKPIEMINADFTTLAASGDVGNQGYTFISTVIVKLVSNAGKEVECRAVIDSGSQVNLVTTRLVQRLGISPQVTNMAIHGICMQRRQSHQRINVEMKSKTSDYNTRVEALVFTEFISPQPSQLIDIREDMPVLQNTVFGWIIAGKLQGASSSAVTCGINTEEKLDQMIERLWKLDEVPTARTTFSKTEERCENHFVQNKTKTKDGRFIVRLPFCDGVSKLGDSNSTALKRFIALERRLSKDIELKEKYTEFMSEYEQLGHMTKININEAPKPYYVIPHHAVHKPDSTSTKLRVVFDASSKTSSGVSLNDIMFSGPVIQSELFSILLRFRLPKYVFCADIQKMYRQVSVHQNDRHYQLIVWRKDEGEPIDYYQLNTVTYGTRAAPYLATRCLLQVAKENKDNYPLGSQALECDFYVDDCLTGNDSLVTTLDIQHELQFILNGAGFKLRKWCANHPQLLQGIAEEDREIDLDFNKENGHIIKTLGLTWRPKMDKFCVKSSLTSCSRRITKRIVTSELAQLFDPLGILAPVIVTAKIFVQELWKLKLTWDEELPEDLAKTWIQFREDLKELDGFAYDRHMFSKNISSSIQIHSFSDASQKAYGAAIYLRARLTDGRVVVRLLCARSRVAPVKKPTKVKAHTVFEGENLDREQTIPRLELCAAVLSAQLTSRVRKDLQLIDTPTTFWIDSEIVLAQINSMSAHFETFVANRISHIQDLTLPEQWRHVRSKQNPADVLSRGLAPRRLSTCTLWHYGPLFLHGEETTWPLTVQDPFENVDRERMEFKRKLPSLALASTAEEDHFINTINHRNSFRTLQRVVGYMLRFIGNASKTLDSRMVGAVLSPQELDTAISRMVRIIQNKHFSDVLAILNKGEKLKETSHVVSLTPFIDDSGIIRVGGRLKSSPLPYDSKHQMLLPYNDPIVKILMEAIHKEQMHCGPQAVLAHTRQRFWPLKGKIIARSVVQHCVRCAKARPQLMTQIMGNLPASRITPARPFINAGVDYCGPFWVHYKIRGKRPHKVYVAIFCCFATKAVHIEVVSDLSTEAFIGALKRFIGRRGHCRNLYCDNATNFVGARNYLSEVMNTIYSNEAREKIDQECSKRAIKFNFIPPRAPHFGGLWEAAVKSAKHLLYRNVSTASLTYEELETVMIEIEAILNSRPITPMSSDPNDLQALTPGHFLIGEPLTAQIDLKASSTNHSSLTRWKLVCHIKHEFWKQWQHEYLNELQCRRKWRKFNANIKEGDMVIIKEDNLPPLQWPLGRILKTYQGNDGTVRVADIKTASGTCHRPIHRLALLPIETDDRAMDIPNQQSTPQDHECTPRKKSRLSASSSKSLLT